MDYMCNCVKNLSAVSILLKFLPYFFKKKTICTSKDYITDWLLC